MIVCPSTVQDSAFDGICADIFNAQRLSMTQVETDLRRISIINGDGVTPPIVLSLVLRF